MPRRSIADEARWVLAGVLFAVCTGCGAPSSPSAPASAAKSRETWDAIYIQDRQVGYLHVVERTTGSPEVIESEAEMRMSMKRDSQATTLEASRKCVETSAGQLVSFRDEQRLGPTPTVTSGQAADGKLLVTVRHGENTAKREINVTGELGGPFAPEHSLRRAPLTPGERRKVTFFDPMLGALTTESLTARDHQVTNLLSGKRKLLRVESSVSVEGQPDPIRGVRWIDEHGETVKYELPGIRQVSYRTTKEQALASGEDDALDVMSAMLVKLSEPFTGSRQTRVVRYGVELTDGDPTKVFSVGATQHVVSTGPHTAEVTVTTMDPHAPACEGAGSVAAPADRAPSMMIQSDDERIVAMAREAAGESVTAGDIAVALEEYVSRQMAKKRNYSVGLATAADVARTLEGDCTEHAVLLAALARASGIPARVAVGLVYSPAQQGFAYHMWTEMLLDRCWVPLDATLGEGRISADHLKLSDTNLADGAGLTSFLPLAEVLGRLKIEVLDAR